MGKKLRKTWMEDKDRDMLIKWCRETVQKILVDPWNYFDMDTICSGDEPWQWFDDGVRRFKVTLEDPRFEVTREGEVSRHSFHGVFREYRDGDASLESYLERFGLNL